MSVPGTAKGLSAPSLSQQQPQADDQHERSQDPPQHGFWQVLSPVPTKIAAHGKAQGDHKSSTHVDIAGLVILPKSQDADGGQQRPERGPLSLPLIHVKEEDQGRNDQHAAARSHHARNCANHQAEKQVEPEHAGIIRADLDALLVGGYLLAVAGVNSSLHPAVKESGARRSRRSQYLRAGRILWANG